MGRRHSDESDKSDDSEKSEVLVVRSGNNPSNWRECFHLVRECFHLVIAQTSTEARRSRAGCAQG